MRLSFQKLAIFLKNHRKLVTRHSSLVTAALAFACLTAPAAPAATPLLCNPYTFIGRITDARGMAFDDNRTATLTATTTAPTNLLLARCTTFHRDDSRNNYRLVVPMATTPADGYALQNDTLLVAATDDLGRLWSGVIDPAVVGVPGTVSDVDIVLADDADGDGIDDTLYQELLDEWAASGLAGQGGEFDPNADHDGDGISTIDEARLGTDPFNGEDALRIDAIDLSTGTPAISASLPAGHVYTLETTHALTAPWTPADFATSDAPSTARDCLSTPSAPDRLPVTLYLFPATNQSPVFFRLNAR